MILISQQDGIASSYSKTYYLNADYLSNQRLDLGYSLSTCAANIQVK